MDYLTVWADFSFVIHLYICKLYICKLYICMFVYSFICILYICSICGSSKDSTDQKRLSQMAMERGKSNIIKMIGQHAKDQRDQWEILAIPRLYNTHISECLGLFERALQVKGITFVKEISSFEDTSDNSIVEGLTKFCKIYHIGG